MASGSEGSAENMAKFLKGPDWLEGFRCEWTKNGRLTIERITDTVPGCLRLYLASIQPKDWPMALTLIEKKEDHCFSDTGISFSRNWSSDEEDEDEEDKSMIGAQAQSDKFFSDRQEESVRIFAGPMHPLRMLQVHFLETIKQALEQCDVSIKGQKEFLEYVQEVKASLSMMECGEEKEGIPLTGSNAPSVKVKDHIWISGLDRTISVDDIMTLPSPPSHVDHSSLRGLDLANREDQSHTGASGTGSACNVTLNFTVEQVQTALQAKRIKTQQELKGQIHTAKQETEALVHGLTKQVRVLTDEKEKAQKILLEHKVTIQQLEDINKTRVATIENLKAENTILFNHNDKLQDEVRILREKDETSQKLLLEKTQKIQQSQETSKDTEALIRSLSKQVTIATEEKEKAQKVLLEQKGTIEQLQDINKTGIATIDKLTSENMKLSNRLSMDNVKHQDEVKTLREENEALQKLLSEKTQETQQSQKTSKDTGAKPKSLFSRLRGRLKQTMERQNQGDDSKGKGRQSRPEESSKEAAVQHEMSTNILLVGCKCNGKSHTGNTILGHEAFRVTRRGGTEKSSLCSSSHDADGDSRKVTVVDTPGVSKEMTESEFEELVRAVKMVPEGFDAICLVWDYDNSERNENKEVQVFQSLHRLFGDELFKHLVILVTHAQQEDIPEFIEGLPHNMKRVADKANAVVAIDNRHKSESSCQQLLQLCPTTGTKYTSSDLSSECQIPPHADLHMVLIGKSGVGKSSTANSIIGEEVFKAATVAASITTKCNFHTKTFKNANTKLAVLDTPGLFATVPNKEEIQKMSEELCKIPTVFHDGIHALILVISGMSRFGEEDDNALKIFQRIFGDRFLEHAIVLITGKDSLTSSKEEYLASAPPALSDILKKCQERCVFFDNVTMDATVRRKQLAKLITMVQEAVKSRKGPYTGQGANERLFLEGEKMISRIITNLSKEVPKEVHGPNDSGGKEAEHPQHAKILRSESLVDRARQYAASDEHEYHGSSIAKSLFQTMQHVFLL